VTYLEMVNEVLVRMREDEIQSVNDVENDPQQKLVCKFVNDARSFVDKSHTWNGQRKLWVVDLKAGEGEYLREANARWMSQQKQVTGSPMYFTPSYVSGHELQVRLYPIPDERHELSGEVAEYSIAEYNEAEYGGSLVNAKQTLVFEGYKASPRLERDTDKIVIPIDPVMYYALAYASRERGEVGGQSSAELFQLAAQYLSDAIAWDVNNSDMEYVWRQV
jgi:hypothetical protein